MQQETLGNQNDGKRGPDFVGEGLAIWLNQDKNGKTYASVKVFGQFRVPCFKPELNKQ